jgi:hypothetical protein
MLPLGVEKWQGVVALFGPLHAAWLRAAPARWRAPAADATGYGASASSPTAHARAPAPSGSLCGRGGFERVCWASRGMLCAEQRSSLRAVLLGLE